jgi:chromosome segregation ATPase
VGYARLGRKPPPAHRVAVCVPLRNGNYAQPRVKKRQLNLYLRSRHGSLDHRFVSVAAVSDDDQGIRDRLSRQGEEALGRIAEELAGSPLVVGALQRAFEAREKASQAQEAAMGALGIPSAADIERLTRRLRSVSQRLEGIEDAVDRLDERLASIDDRLGKTTAKAGRAKKGDSGSDARLEEIARDLAALRAAVAPGEEPPPRAQERLTVTES